MIWRFGDLVIGATDGLSNSDGPFGATRGTDWRAEPALRLCDRPSPRPSPCEGEGVLTRSKSLATICKTCGQMRFWRR